MSVDKNNGDSILDRFPDTPPKHNGATKKQTKEQQLALDAFAWFFNVSTSVLIVFVNKQLMSGNGLNYRFGACGYVWSRCVISRLHRSNHAVRAALFGVLYKHVGQHPCGHREIRGDAICRCA